MELILAGTGHRPNKLGGYNTKTDLILLNLALVNIKDLNPTKIISGMTLGWDTALALAAIMCHIPVIAAVPCKEQDKFWNKDNQETYKDILNHPLVTTHYVSDLPYTNMCMQERNKWMVNNCTKVLALWDGSNGGTANCINYAKKMNREVLNVYNIYLKIKEEHDKKISTSL